MKVNQWLFYHLNKGQVLFTIVGIFLILFVFSVIILGNINISSSEFSFAFKKYISLKSLEISGLRYVLYQINQNPSFTTSSGQIIMPQGSINYSVSNLGSDKKIINIVANLSNSLLTRTLKATATIDSFGNIIDLETSEE
jgi:hypothetical protein